MRADYSNGYYYVSSDSDSLAGEESSILRVEAKEFESFIDNFILARALNNSMGIQHVEIGREKSRPDGFQDYPVGLSHLSSVSVCKD